MHASLLNRALCLITSNQLVVSFLCSLGCLVLCSSASWLRLALFSGHLFFGAGNSEKCLNQFSGKREAGAASSISGLTASFLALTGKKFEFRFSNLLVISVF